MPLFKSIVCFKNWLWNRSASPTESIMPPNTISSRNEAPQRGHKRKKSEPSEDAITDSSQPNKRIKLSNAIIDCKVALKVLRGINFLDTRFLNSGKVLAWALEPDHPDFSRIHEYFANTQNSYETPMKIVSILRIITAAHNVVDAAPLDFNDYLDASDMQRVMLWHGTPSWNVSSILENGFRAPYPGRGIFFADRVATCRFCCNRGLFGSVGYLFLCDVLLGRKDHRKETDFRSVVGDIECHSQVPARWMDKTLDKEVDGCLWPSASRTARTGAWTYRPYNVFTVYNPAQLHPKYLIKVQF